MGNPFYSPRNQNNIGNTLLGAASLLANQKQATERNRLTEQEMGMRERVADQQIGVSQERNRIDAGGLKLGQDALAFKKDQSIQQTPEHKKKYGAEEYANTTNKIILELTGKGAMGEDGKELVKTFAPVNEFFKSAASSNYTKKQVADLTQKHWPQLRAQTIENLTKLSEKKIKDPLWAESPAAKRTFGLIDALNADARGMEVNGETIENPMVYSMFSNTYKSQAQEAQAFMLERDKAKGKPPETWGKEYKDEYGNIVQRNETTGGLKKISGPARGMVAQMGPDGQFTLTTGANPDKALQTPVRAKTALFADAVTHQQTLDTIGQIETLYEPEFLSYKGAIKGVAATVLNKMDPEKRSQFQTRRSAFISAANKAFLTFRKWATGVAGGEKEMAEIKRATFSEEDSPQDFESKMQMTKSLTRRLLARTKAAMKDGINNDKAFKEYIQEHPLGSVPTLQARGDQLSGQGYDESQVMGILKSEGYILGVQ